MNEYLYLIKFKLDSVPRPLKQVVFGLGFMVLSIILSKTSGNVIYFIFSASFALLGLVLFMMGMINACLEIARHFMRKKTLSDNKP